MADDINLPNLISHLNVDLDGVSGAIGDATRQGSAMGAALGSGINRQLDDLLRNLPQVQIDGNSDPLDRDLARVHRQLAQLDAQRIGVDVSVGDALRQLEDLEANLQRIGDQHPNVNVRAATAAAARQLEELRAAAQQVDDTDVDIRVDVDEDAENRLRRLGGLLGQAGAAGARAGASIATSMGAASAAIGAVVPLAAGLVTTLANVAPAAGVAVTGLAAVQLASGTVKLAAVGMEDALTAALDPEKAAEFEEALGKLSPEAARFATAVRDAAPALRDMQQAVQDEVFRGLADNLERTGRVVLPVLRTNLLSTATALGDMAAGVLGAARDLGESGTLGQALGSASRGLQNLSGIPGVLVTGLGQVAAAAGPSFERLTAAAADAAFDIGDRLSAAFEDGRMQAAIEDAIDLLGDMADVGGNVIGIISNIFGAVPEGGGLLGVLEEVTGALEEITASSEVQTALRTLFETMAAIGETVAPLLAQALAAVAPVITALGPPVQTLVAALGDALSPIIEALGPVLEAAARAFGALIVAVSPLLPVLGQLIADLLPVLVPLFDALTVAFEAAAPALAILAQIIGQTLTPILQSLGPILQPILDTFAEMARVQGPLLADMLRQLQPSFVLLGEALGQLLTALGPLLVQLSLVGAQLFQQIAPYLPPLIQAFAELALILSAGLSVVINNIVVPALSFLNALLTGDTAQAAVIAGGAMQTLQRLMATVWSEIVSYTQRKIAEAIVYIGQMPGRASAALSGLGAALRARAVEAGVALLQALQIKLSDAVRAVQELPRRVTLGNLGGVLRSAGVSLIAGFIDGIRSMIPSVQSVLSGLTSSLPDWKGPPSKDAKILTKSGRLVIAGFIKGIDDSTATLRKRLDALTKSLPSNITSGIGKQLARATRELDRLVTRRDAIIKKLEAGQKRLADLLKAQREYSADIRDRIIGDANITAGNADVNSVSAITIGLQQAVKQAQEFQANLDKLRKAGLRTDLLQQIAEAGAEAGAATAAALAKATPEELAKINQLQGQLAKSATATGNSMGDALYGAGIRAAEGLIAGLKAREKFIEQQMRRIAESMLKTVKKAHKTRSPSRAFWDQGAMDMEGLRLGIRDNAAKVVAATRAVAVDMLGAASGLSASLSVTPSAGQLAAVYAGGGRGDTYHTWNLHGTEASPDGILRALSWRGLVGGR